jgi:hypothetical protein
LVGGVAGACALVSLAVLALEACLHDLPADAYVPGGGDAATDGAPAASPVCGDGIIERDLGESCDPGPDAAVTAASSCDPAHCTVLCPDGGFVGPTNDHCYFTLDAGHVSQSSATSGCAAQGAHVVTFDSDGEEGFVDRSFGDAGPYWLPLQLDTPVDAKPVYDVGAIDEPGWRSTCSGCYGTTIPAGAIDFVNVCKLTAGMCVAHGPASTGYVGVDCAGTCADAGLLVHAVCEREPAGYSGQSCDDGGLCLTLKATSSTYELVSDRALTWPDAQQACLGKGGHLVVFETAEERAQLSHELAGRIQAGSPELEYWVGLHNTSSSSIPAWTWVNEMPVAAYPLEWADGEPSAGYVWAYGLLSASAMNTNFDRQLLKTNLENDNGVQITLPFVCEFEGTDGGGP